MHLEFYAKEVTYLEAMDQEIEQAFFQEYPDPEIDYSIKKTPMPEPIKSVGFSASYEFPPHTAKVEWCDGEDWGGGEAIKKLHLTDTEFTLLLINGDSFHVKFVTDDVTFKNIKQFLSKHNATNVV